MTPLPGDFLGANVCKAPERKGLLTSRYQEQLVPLGIWRGQRGSRRPFSARSAHLRLSVHAGNFALSPGWRHRNGGETRRRNTCMAADGDHTALIDSAIPPF